MFTFYAFGVFSLYAGIANSDLVYLSLGKVDNCEYL